MKKFIWFLGVLFIIARLSNAVFPWLKVPAITRPEWTRLPRWAGPYIDLVRRSRPAPPSTKPGNMCEDPRDVFANNFYNGEASGLSFWDQGQTGSCWACAASDAVSLQANIQGFDGENEDPQKLSAQQLRECCGRRDTATVAPGITPTGNTMSFALEHATDPGLVLNETYPFQTGLGICNKEKYQEAIYKAAVSRSFVGPEHVEQCLQKHVIIAAVRMDPSFDDYGGNIIKKGCKGKTNHYIIITGTKEINGTKVWVARNSKGDNWGDEGLMYISRAANNPICIYDELNVIKVEKNIP